MTDSLNETQKTTQAPHSSTLIEFPGVNRNRPAWRKELSEKVREIQQRRAREAALDEGAAHARPQRPAAPVRAAEAAGQAADAQAAAGEEAAKQLGLVPPPEAPELNPLVVAALRRIERARTRTQHSPRAAGGRAQAAAARVIEEQFEQEEEQAPRPGQVMRPAPAAGAEKQAAATKAERPEAPHPSNLLVVSAPRAEAQQRPQPTPQPAAQVATTQAPAAPAAPRADRPEASRAAAKAEATEARAFAPAHTAAPAAAAAAETKEASSAAEAGVAAEADGARPQPRKIAGVIDDHWLERHGSDPLPKVEAAAYDDRAPVGGRLGAALFDLLAVALLCAPFAAVIELTIGEWRDPRVYGSMGAVVGVVMFLYHTCAVALAGRSWGMRLFSLHAVDADSARVPSTWQCAVRALVYMLSLASFGLGILYALIDAERRTAHDLLSRTVVVKE